MTPFKETNILILFKKFVHWQYFGTNKLIEKRLCKKPKREPIRGLASVGGPLHYIALYCMYIYLYAYIFIYLYIRKCLLYNYTHPKTTFAFTIICNLTDFDNCKLPKMPQKNEKCRQSPLRHCHFYKHIHWRTFDSDIFTFKNYPVGDTINLVQ